MATTREEILRELCSAGSRDKVVELLISSAVRIAVPCAALSERASGAGGKVVVAILRKARGAKVALDCGRWWTGAPQGAVHLDYRQLLQYANNDALRVLHKKLVALSSSRRTNLARTQSVPARIPDDDCGNGEAGSLHSTSSTDTPMGGNNAGSLQRTSSGTVIRRTSHGHSSQRSSSTGIAFGSAAVQRTVGGHDSKARLSHRLSSSAAHTPGSAGDSGARGTGSGDLDSAQKRRPTAAAGGGEASVGSLSPASVACTAPALPSSPAQLGLEDSACNPEEEPGPALAPIKFQGCFEPAADWPGSLGGDAGSGVSTPPAACSPAAGGAEGLSRQGTLGQTSMAELEEQAGAAGPPVCTDGGMAADAAEWASFGGTQLAAAAARLSSEELREVGPSFNRVFVPPWAVPLPPPPQAERTSRAAGVSEGPGVGDAPPTPGRRASTLADAAQHFAAFQHQLGAALPHLALALSDLHLARGGGDPAFARGRYYYKTLLHLKDELRQVGELVASRSHGHSGGS